MFLEECPQHLSRIRSAIREKDPLSLQRAAHTLKGLVANFEDKTAVEASFRLETMGRQGDLADVEATLAVLEGEIAELRRALAVVLREEANP